MLHLDANTYPEVASTFQVLTAPVILLFFEGKEVHRQARFIDFKKLEELVKNYQSINLSVSYDELFS
jgi:thioredoxin-like negative regulator of GroEL